MRRVPLLLLIAACRPSPATAPAAVSSAPRGVATAAFDADERVAAAAITTQGLAARTRYLADDALEGRAPGSRGRELGMKFIAADLETQGLAPGAEGGTSWFQRVPLVGIDAHVPSTVQATTPKGALSLKVPEDLVIMSGVQKKEVSLPPSDVVFVGYGIVAPEFGWDDYKDVDVRGKVVVVMNN